MKSANGFRVRLLSAVSAWLSVLCLGAALLPCVAKAQGEFAEEFYQPRAEIRDAALKGVIGLVTVGMGPEPRSELPVYEVGPEGHFRLAGSLPLEQTRAISGLDDGIDSVRRFPVVARRGEYLLAVVDARSGERAWIREHEWRGPEDYVLFNTLEEAFLGAGVDVLALSREARAPLYRAPSPKARSADTAMEPPLDALRVMRMQGDFAQVGISRGVEEDPEPVGWIRIRDDKGLLVVWPVMTDDC